MTPKDMATVHAAAFRSERPWTEDEFLELLSASHTSLAVHAQGFALWRAIAGEAELLTIAVQPDWQNRGVGRQLMRGWMASATEVADVAFLEVADDNLAACSLYSRCGFDVVSRRLGYYTRPRGRADALLMRASLD